MKARLSAFLPPKPRLPKPRPLRVVGVPAFQNRDMNPYNALLYESLSRLGVDAREVTFGTIFGKRPDIFHVHWPEYLFSAKNTFRALMNAAAFVIVISYLALRKVRIVWTVHNLSAHESRHPKLEQRMWRWFVKRVDAVISMTSTGAEAALHSYPELAECQAFVIPHGHYADVYPADADRASARQVLGLGDEPVIVFFGAVRPYKGVVTLIDAFRDVADPTWTLLVAGKPSNPDYGGDVMDASAGDNRIRLALDFVPDDHVQFYLRAADLVVLPYRDILNSGSAILALSFGARVLVPALGAANDLAQLIGSDWIRTYAGELTSEALEGAMAWSIERRTLDCPPLDELAWDRIAEQTNRAYVETLSMPPRRVQRAWRAA